MDDIGRIMKSCYCSYKTMSALSWYWLERFQLFRLIAQLIWIMHNILRAQAHVFWDNSVQHMANVVRGFKTNSNISWKSVCATVIHCVTFLSLTRDVTSNLVGFGNQILSHSPKNIWQKILCRKKLHLDNSDYMQNLEHYQLSCNLECDSDKSQIKQRLKDWGRLFTQRKQTIVWFETHQFYDFHTCFNQQGFVLSWNWRMHLKVLRLHCFLNVSSDYMYLKHF